MKIHHLGVVTADVAETLRAFRLRPEDIVETVYDPVQKNNLHFIRLVENDMWLELVEPLASDASTARFAKKFGIGLHHMAMSSDDLDTEVSSYADMPGAFPLGRYGISVQSFGGRIRTLFVAIKGLIIEFVKIE
jgi:hypothetical protein